MAGLLVPGDGRGRHPGGLDVDHGHDGHVTARDGRGRDGHGHDHVVVPPAAGSRLAEVVTTIPLLIGAVFSWIVLVNVGFMHQDARIALLPWIVSGDLNVGWTLRVDTLTFSTGETKMINRLALTQAPQMVVKEKRVSTTVYEQQSRK